MPTVSNYRIITNMKLTIPAISEVKQRIKQPLYKNSFFLLLNNSMGGVLGFVFWILVARFYPPADVGNVSALIASVMFLVAFSRLGFDMGIIRFISSEKDKPLLINSCLTITGLVSLTLALIYVAGLDFWSPALSFIHDNVAFLIVFVVFTVSSTLSIMLGSVFVAFRHSEFFFMQNMIVGALRLTLPILAVSAGIFGLFFSWGIGLCLAIVISLFWFLRRLLPGYHPLPRINKSVVKNITHFSFMNYITGVFQVIPMHLLPLLILNTLGADMTAFFRIAWAISGFLFLAIPVAVSTSLLAEGSHNPEKLRSNVIRAGGLMLLLIVPGIAVLFLFGEKILLLFGTAYSENGLRLLKILSLSGIPLIFIQLFISVRWVQLRMKSVILVVALTAVITLGAIYILLPQYGLIGVGIGWTSSQAIVAVFIGLMILVQRKTNYDKIPLGENQ